uniref:Reticulon n=1 Tax=Sander lucioperca TaxID=283035 RepID=A0A8D0CTA4_SANLU
MYMSLLDRDISVSPESIRLLVDRSLVLLNRFTDQMRKLLLVEDMFDSLKLAGVMWMMTYVGAIFNGVSILILADIVFFSTPLIYQKKKVRQNETNINSVFKRTSAFFLSASSPKACTHTHIY